MRMAPLSGYVGGESRTYSIITFPATFIFLERFGPEFGALFSKRAHSI